MHHDIPTPLHTVKSAKPFVIVVCSEETAPHTTGNTLGIDGNSHVDTLSIGGVKSSSVCSLEAVGKDTDNIAKVADARAAVEP